MRWWSTVEEGHDSKGQRLETNKQTFVMIKWINNILSDSNENNHFSKIVGWDLSMLETSVNSEETCLLSKLSSQYFGWSNFSQS